MIKILYYMCGGLLTLYLALEFFLCFWVFRTTKDWAVLYDVWVVRRSRLELSERQLSLLRVVGLLKRIMIVSIVLTVAIGLILKYLGR